MFISHHPSCVSIAFDSIMRRFVDTCVAECDRRAVLGALMTHVAKIGQPDYKRPSKVRQRTSLE